MSEYPSHLYHYTSIDSLAMILKNQNIKFNSLCNMDDLQEQRSNDLQNFGKFIFVSSWTEECEEYIPMWRMYTKKGEGVRIKLRTNPFKEYIPNIEEINIPGMKIAGVMQGDSLIKTLPFRSAVPISEIYHDDYFVYGSYDKLLYKVEYTTDNSILVPTVLAFENGKGNAQLNKLGSYKNSFWEFQKEWRYILNILPISLLKGSFNPKSEWEAFQSEIQKGKSALKFDSYNLKLSGDAFNEMEITLAPDISEGSRLIVNLLRDNYNPTAKIEESSLFGLLR